MPTSDELLDAANELATRYPGYCARATRRQRQSLRTVLWARIGWGRTLEIVAALPDGPERRIAERRSREDEQLFALTAEQLRDALESMKPPSADHARIEREMIRVFPDEPASDP